ncbi:hypothetical protein [Streptomyces sp. NBC_00211]
MAYAAYRPKVDMPPSVGLGSDPLAGHAVQGVAATGALVMDARVAIAD